MGIRDAADSVEAIDVAVAAGYALVIVAVAAERVWLLFRTGSARIGALATSAVMGGGAVVAGVMITAVERAVWPVVGAVAPAPLLALMDVHLVVEVAVVFVAWDAAGFAHHWLGHRSAVGWASHQVHHSGADYDLSLAWRQSWFPVTALVTFPLVALTGTSFEMAVGCALASNTWQALLHTSVPLRTPAWVEAAVMTPRSHLRHHQSSTPVNLGPVLTLWDRFAGTWCPHDRHEALRADEIGARRQGAVAIEIAGWRSLAAETARR